MVVLRLLAPKKKVFVIWVSSCLPCFRREQPEVCFV